MNLFFKGKKYVFQFDKKLFRGKSLIGQRQQQLTVGEKPWLK